MTFTTKQVRKLNARGAWVYRTVYLVDRREVTRAEYKRLYREQTPKVDTQAHHILPKNRRKHWPIESQALGVHPDQIELAKKLDKARGAPPTEYTKSGEPILTSHFHRKAFLKAHRFVDRSGFN